MYLFCLPSHSYSLCDQCSMSRALWSVMTIGDVRPDAKCVTAKCITSSGNKTLTVEKNVDLIRLWIYSVCTCTHIYYNMYTKILTDQQSLCQHFFKTSFPVYSFPINLFGHCVWENPRKYIPSYSFGVLSSYSTESRNLTIQKSILVQQRQLHKLYVDLLNHETNSTVNNSLTLKKKGYNIKLSI